ncbi:hypothetical protein GpartN1_g4967.t1 [Galdieria partita]|uniref:Acidic leucine-rich nuclear phosphoprotein 32-related protein n=1 Tax=Galdieria partita TaxID=83374 RepID=A0A9C7PZ04_9RHOD|nr:hypothetical protein GpartN1_g2617.t1 [Galdieria partita]GJQ13176.1 hypothetical protein GpartN1_g4967.t1 [Galdieria partita]
MEVAVQKAINSRSRNEVKELYLDNQCRTSKPAGLEDFSSLTFLSLNNIGLTSLEGLPRLPKLTTLETSDNMISTGLSVLANAAPRLEVLKLGGNRLANFKDLESLSRLKNLRVLDLYGNPVTNSTDYREKVFAMIPSLEILDGADKEGNEIGSEEEDEEEEVFTENDVASVEDDDYDQIDSVLSKPYGRITQKGEVSEDESLEDVEDNSESEEMEDSYARAKKNIGRTSKVLTTSKKSNSANDDEGAIGLNGKRSEGRLSHAAAKKNSKGSRNDDHDEEEDDEEDREDESDEDEASDEGELGGSFGGDDDDDDDDDDLDDNDEIDWDSQEDEDELNDDDEDEDEEEEEEDDDDDEEDEDEEEPTVSKKRRAAQSSKQKAKNIAKGRGGGGLRAAANKRRRSGEESSDDDDE